MLSNPQATSVPPYNPTTLVDLLRWRGTHQSERLAYTFLVDGESVESRLTYGELDRQARTIGATLQQMGATGERVLLLYPAGLEYIAAFFGCLYAGAIAVPAYPPRLNRSLERVEAIVADAQASLALTTTALMSKTGQWFTETPALATLHWRATDKMTSEVEDTWHAPDINRETLAFLQYTSGSTGSPKGVMLSHRNLLHNVHMIQSAFEHTEQSIGVGWLPLYHDMGLIGNVLQPLYVGFPCILMSPVAFLQRPVRWLQAISHYRATGSGGPNFAYDLCVRKITPAQRATLDLSCWEMAFNGAEPIRQDTLERFAQAFVSCGFRREAFYPCYGLAEATLLVSGGMKAAPPVMHTVHKAFLEDHQVAVPCVGTTNAQSLVGCGQALSDEQRIVIVDPKSHTLCPSGRIGEIWVASPSIAQGYWNRPTETVETFQAYLADTGEGPFLRTGDLGFFHAGELFVTGRLKDVIIIRGSNHYPQDIEATVERSHPSLRPNCGAAFAIEVAGEERLVVVQEVERRQQPASPHFPERRHADVEPGFEPAQTQKLDLNEVISKMRQAVAEEHGLQAYAILLLRAGSLPKTSSGKVQRHACRAAYLDRSLLVVGGSPVSFAPSHRPA
jgi:acyl-CoA synthetase (AMP-forming)/AMP-acid ligase II